MGFQLTIFLGLEKGSLQPDCPGGCNRDLLEQTRKIGTEQATCLWMLLLIRPVLPFAKQQ